MTPDLQWLANACTGGFLFLCGCIIALWQKVKATDELNKKLIDISISIKNIEKALLGSYENPGLVHKHADLVEKTTFIDKRLHQIEEKIKING